MLKKQIDIEKAIRLYRDEGKHTPEVSKAVGCSVQTLITRLRDAGVTIRTAGESHQKIDFETIRHEYEDLKMSTSKIASKHGMSQVSMWGRLVNGGVQMRDRKEEARKACITIPVSDHLSICERYKTNKHESCADIAEDYGVHRTTIAAVLKKNNITPEHSGARIKSYKGGITKLHTRIRNCEKAEFLRRACMERDDYKCRISGEVGKLEVHHYPKVFSKMFNEFLALHTDLNPIEDCDELLLLSQDYESFWEIDNGMTVTEEMHKRLHMHNGIKDEELISLHDKGWSCQRISKYFGKSASFVRARFLAIGQARKSPGFYNKMRSEISEETQAGVLEAYVRGDVVRQICNRYDIASSTLYKILRDNQIIPGNRKKSTESKARQESTRVHQLRDSGVTVQELARMYEVSDTTIRNILL
jgi:transposase-like protein